MAFNGAGTFQRIYNWVNDKNNNINITASRVDTEDDGFATGLSNCICRDGQSTISANIPFNSKKITGLGVGSANTDSVTLGQSQINIAGFSAAGGTADAITGTFTPTITALVDGMILRVRAGAANATTTPTFAPDGLTAHTITKTGNVALAAGDIVGSGHELLLQYNLAGTRWELLNPGVSLSAYLTTATAASTYLAKANNLSDVANATTSLTNLGGAPTANPTFTTGITTPKVTFNSTSGIIGTTTNDNAAAGSVGETISSSIASGSAVSLSTGTAKDVTSISLTAGDWEVSGVVNFTGGATTTVTKLSGGISTTTNTMPTQSTTNPGTINLMCYSTNWAAFQNGDPSVALPPARISIASTTTVYLDALAVFGTSTASAYGMIKARRVR